MANDIGVFGPRLEITKTPAVGQVPIGNGAGFDLSIMSSADVTFLQAGTGAVTRTVQSKERDIVSVKDFGAVGDNSTDDTTAIQNAVTAANSFSKPKDVFFPSGRYKISSEITMPLNSTSRLIGEGLSNSIIRQTNATANGVVFTYDNYLTTGGGVIDLSIEAGAGFVCAQFFGQGSTGVGLKVVRANDNFTTRGIGIHNFAGGMHLLGCWNGRHNDLQVLFFSDNGVLIDTSTPGIVGGITAAGNTINGAKISNNGYSGTGTSSVGVRIRASGGEYFVNIDVTSAQVGWQIDPRTGDQVLYLFGFATLADASGGSGWVFDATNGLVWDCQFYNFWASYNTDHGVTVSGSNLKDIQVWGRSRENGKHGVLMNVGGLYWRGGKITNNGRLTAATYDGVNVAANASRWAVQNSVIGNNGTSLVAQQRDGIRVASGTNDFYAVEGCEFVGNTGVPMTDANSPSNTQLTGNIPRGTSVINRDQAQIFRTSTGTSPPTGGVTIYMGFTASAAPDQAAWRADRNYVITNLTFYSTGAPGIGQTFTYTLFVNGAATALSAVSSGASSFSAIANSTAGIAVSAGNTLYVQLVTSALAVLVDHSGSLRAE